MDGYQFETNRRWLRFGAILAAAVVLGVVAFAFGRMTAPSAPAPGRASTATQSGPGPTRVVNGVPVGYARTQAGAVAAATNFLMVVDGPLVTQPDKYRSAIDTLSAPDARDKQRRDAETTLTELQNLASGARQGRNVVFRTVALAYRVQSYTPSSAQLSVWAEGLVAVDGVLSLRATWATIPLTVAWTGGDWRLSSIAPTSQQSPGPVPAMVQASNVDVVLPPQLSDYRSYEPHVGS